MWGFRIVRAATVGASWHDLSDGEQIAEGLSERRAASSATGEEASGGVDGGKLEYEPSEAEAASGATSDFAVAAATAATPASVGRSRESAGWPPDGAAVGGSTDERASVGADGRVVQLEVKGDGGKAAASKAVPGLAAVASSDAASTSNGASREAAASRKPDGGSTRSEGASGEPARLELEGDGDGETAPEAASGLAAAVSSDAASASSGVPREAAGWHVDGAADGEESGGADGGELEQEPSGVEAAPSATSVFAHPL